MDLINKFFDKSSGSSHIAKKRLRTVLSQERERISATKANVAQCNFPQGISSFSGNPALSGRSSFQ